MIGIGGGSAALMQELAQRAGALLLHLLIQSVHTDRDLARFVILAAIRLAVGLKAAPLIEVEQRPADFEQRQFLVERAGAQGIGVFIRQPLSIGLIRRKQAIADQIFEERGLTLFEPVTPPSHGPRSTPIDRQRGPGLGIAPIAEDAGPHGEDADGIARAIQPQGRPTQ